MRDEPHQKGGPLHPTSLVSHVQTLRRYAWVLVGNHSDADDLVQETLKRALTYVGDGKQVDNPRSYLLTMLHHVQVDMVRRRRRSGEEVEIDDLSLVSTDPHPDDKLEYRQVLAAVHALPEHLRQVILLVGLEGLSYRETAEILSVPLGTVMSRLHRARAALRETVGHAGIDRLAQS